MKRTLTGKNDDSEDEVWNYKSRGYSKLKISEIGSQSGPQLVSGSGSQVSNEKQTKSRRKPHTRRVVKQLKYVKSPNLKNNSKLRSDTLTTNATESPVRTLPSIRKTPTTVLPNSQELTPSRRSTEHCPSCQVPFSALTTDSPSWHAMKCLDITFATPRPECPFAASCTNTLVSHYQKYIHNLLASLRAGLDTDCKLNSVTAHGANQFIINNQATTAKQLNFNEDSKDKNGSVTMQPLETITLNGNACSDTSKGFYGNFSQQKSNTDAMSVNEMPNKYDIVNSPLQCMALLEDKGCNSGKEYGCISDEKHFCHNRFEMTDHYGVNSTLESFILGNSEDISSQKNRVSCAETDENNDSTSELTNDSLCEFFPDDFVTPLELPKSQELQKSRLAEVCHRKLANDDGNKICQKTDLQKISSSQTGLVLKKCGRRSSDSVSVRQHSKQTKCLASDQNNGLQQLQINMFFKTINSTDSFSNNQMKVAIDTGMEKVCEHSQGFNLDKNKNSLFKRTWRSNSCETEISQLKMKDKLASHSNGEIVTAGQDKNTREAPLYTSVHRTVRSCPFYKKIPNTAISVDAFSYGTVQGCCAYFLSHFHSDHYMGLTKNFSHNLYCSQITANLILLKFKVQPHLIHALPLNEPQIVEGVEVTLLDANHCPGSVMMLFKLRSGQIILHTGDFRADASMEHIPQLQAISISQLFLDTTYCEPAYDFPSQKDVIQFAVEKMMDFACKHPNLLVVVGSYLIGKERVFLSLAEALDCKIFVTREKKSVLTCLEDKSLNERMTLKPCDAKLHVLKMNQLNLTDLNMYLESLKPRFNHLLAFEPTGWTHNKTVPSLNNIRPRAYSKNVTLYSVPYSEHSSYSEMKRFVQFLCPQKIIPTVNNGSLSSRRKMEQIFAIWLSSPSSQPVKSRGQQISLNWWLDNS